MGLGRRRPGRVPLRCGGRSLPRSVRRGPTRDGGPAAVAAAAGWLSSWPLRRSGRASSFTPA
eukprot:8946332-Alexandrium_andersonii.AAC.1